MLQIIRKGDKTTHGGSVMTGSDTMKFGGIGVARKGGMVSRPIPGHGATTIIEGNLRGGRYRVKLDFDRNSTEQGYAYRGLRMVKPYAGDSGDWHTPLLDGTEVPAMFDGGDPDRSYIACVQHDSEHPPPATRDNHTRHYIQLSKSGITEGTEGNDLVQPGNDLVPGSAADMSVDTPDFDVTDITGINQMTSQSFNG